MYKKNVITNRKKSSCLLECANFFVEVSGSANYCCTLTKTKHNVREKGEKKRGIVGLFMPKRAGFSGKLAPSSVR